MSLEQAILDAIRALPAEKQQEVLSHATRLRDQTTEKQPLRSVKGIWADLGISLSAEEIEANQREMWKNFPRGNICHLPSRWTLIRSFGISPMTYGYLRRRQTLWIQLPPPAV